jgi:hypothetical protein
MKFKCSKCHHLLSEHYEGIGCTDISLDIIHGPSTCTCKEFSDGDPEVVEVKKKADIDPETNIDVDQYREAILRNIGRLRKTVRSARTLTELELVDNLVDWEAHEELIKILKLHSAKCATWADEACNCEFSKTYLRTVVE